jgi:hypothetical protein
MEREFANEVCLPHYFYKRLIGIDFFAAFFGSPRALFPDAIPMLSWLFPLVSSTAKM